MPTAFRMTSALARSIVALATLAAMLVAAGPPIAVAQEAPIAPEPSEAAIEENVNRGGRDADAAARPIEVVELLASKDVPRSRHQGLLAREIARQSVLLAAREGLGLRTRDQLLREGAARDSTPGRLLIDAQITFDKNGEVVVDVARIDGKRRHSLVRSTKRFADGKTIDYPALAAWCEELSRGEIAAALRTAASLPPPDAASRENADVDELPADVAPRLRRMTFASQFAAVRRLHELAHRDGPTSAASAALARAYANLGVLGELYWHPASAAFKARSLLYAQRAIAVDGSDSPASVRNRRSLGYCLALCGLHRAATETFAAAKTPSAAAIPPWAVVAEALCDFDHPALAKIPIESEGGEIARVCQVLMAEHASITPEDMDYETDAATEKRLTAVALELPHCWRVRAAVGRRVYDAGGRETFNADWYRDVAATPRLASAAAEIVERQVSGAVDVVAEQKSRAELIATLRSAAGEDRHEPSLGVLATLIEEASFVDAFEYAQLMVRGYDRDEIAKAVQDFRKNVVPIVERHPLCPMLNSCLDILSSDDPSRIYRYNSDSDELLNAIELSTATTAVLGLLDNGYGIPNHGNAGKLHKAIIAHADETFADLATLAVRYDVGDKEHYAEKLYDTSPRAPQAVAGMIQHHWTRVADKAEAWEGRYADDQSVLAMLGSRYLAEKHPADARRCFQAYLKLTTTRQWASLWAYRHLADTYRAEGDTRRWLSTLEAFLREEGSEDGRSDVQVMIAQHYLTEGDYAQALHFAESVDGYNDTDAQIVVAQCHEYRQRHLAAERTYRAVASDDPYSPHVLLWHRYCAQSGYGNMTPPATPCSDTSSRSTKEKSTAANLPRDRSTRERTRRRPTRISFARALLRTSSRTRWPASDISICWKTNRT